MTLLSKLDTSCVEYVHPWSDSCVKASLALMPACLRESFRIYVTAYTVSLLMRGKVPTSKDLRQTFFGILQSCIFLTSHGVGYSAALCIIRKLTGDFNFLTVSFLPSFVSSIVSILIERPSRRGLLSLYVTNVASETLFRMAVDRKLFKPIPYGEVFVFAVSVANLLYFYRGPGLPKDPIYSLLRFLVGPYEEHCYVKKDTNHALEQPHLKQASGEKLFLIKYKLLLENWWKQFVFRIKSLPSHPTCPHSLSCTYYVLQGGSKVFGIGYCLQVALKYFLSMKSIKKNPSLLWRIPLRFENMGLATCFMGFTTLFRSANCFLRRINGKDNALYSLPAGFLAGLSFYFYRDNTIALYFMWKTVQICYHMGVQKGIFVELPWASVFFHAFSTAILFHVAILEPHNLRKSYWNFLQAMSGGRIAQMDRKCIDNFGLNTSKHLADVLSGSHVIR